MTDENLEWAGIYKATDNRIIANYHGSGVSDKKTVTVSITYNYDETERIIKAIKKFMFTDKSEFTIKYCSSGQEVIMSVSWDNIIEFLSNYIDGRKNKKINITGEIK